jgi:hypothetical protein
VCELVSQSFNRIDGFCPARGQVTGQQRYCNQRSGGKHQVAGFKKACFIKHGANLRGDGKCCGHNAWQRWPYDRMASERFSTSQIRRKTALDLEKTEGVLDDWSIRSLEWKKKAIDDTNAVQTPARVHRLTIACEWDSSSTR